MTIYSYINEDEDVEERLEDHIYKILSIIKDVNNTKIGIYLERIFGSSSHLINGFNRALALSAILHDTGKIFYQDKTTFVGHEFYSTYISQVFLSELEIEDIMYNWMDEVLFSILMHHHAMGIKERLKYVKRFSEQDMFKALPLLPELQLILTDCLKKSGLQLYQNLMIKTLNKVENDIRRLKSNFSTEVNKLAEEISRNLWRIYVREELKKKTFLISVTLLTVADYIAGYEGRKGKPTEFYKTVQDFYKIYLDPNFIHGNLE